MPSSSLVCTFVVREGELGRFYVMIFSTIIEIVKGRLGSSVLADVPLPSRDSLCEGGLNSNTGRTIKYLPFQNNLSNRSTEMIVVSVCDSEVYKLEFNAMFEK